MPPRIAALALVLVASAGAPAGSAETCPGFFADGRRPALVNPKLTSRTIPLCYGAFALLHSGVSRTPVYAAQRLTREGIRAARKVDRLDSFHDEDRLPDADRARLDDYVHSGFDRGHMAPAADMPTLQAQGESFTLANIVPQDRGMNRSLWAAVEESVRRLAVARGTLFVVTGPIFEGDAIQSVAGRVLVPTHLFKAVYDPARGEAGAYLAENRADAEWSAISLRSLKELSGLDPYPALDPTVKATSMTLPEPRAYSRDGERSLPRDVATFESWAKNELHRLARRLWRDLLRSIF